MVKKLALTTFLIFSISNATDFENSCLKCHNNSFQFQMFMKRYTIKYSSERRIKNAIFNYLKNPSYKESVLPFGYINRFGIKDKTDLSDHDLKKMINVYYERYNIKSKIY